MTYRFAWYPSLDNIEFPADAYDALLSRMATVTPFNRLAWLRACAMHLDGARLGVLTAWVGERLVLCLPLVAGRERRLGLRWTVVRHLGYPLADRIVLAAETDLPGLLEHALTHIRRQLPHALLQLNEVLPVAKAETELAAWGGRSSTWLREVSCRVPEHRIVPEDREEPSGDVRYKLRRARKRCTEAGAVLRRVQPTLDTIGPLLNELAEVELASWKGEDNVGLFSAHCRPQIEAALTALAAEGRVRVVLLELQGQCISYRLALLENARLYDYNLAYHPDHARLGSGRLLLHEWIIWGLEAGWEWVDASRVNLHNSNHQLHERMDGLVEHGRWSFYSRRPGGLVLGLAHRAWLVLKPRLNREATV